MRKLLEKDSRQIELFIRFCAFTVLIGRAAQYLFRDAPYRAFLWKEDWLAPIIEQFTPLTWREWVTSMSVNNCITYIIKFHGLILLIGAFLVFTAQIFKLSRFFLWYSVGILILDSLLGFLDKGLKIGMLIEHSLQWGIVLILLLYIKKAWSPLTLYRNIGILTVLCFLGHGLYAIGYHSQPGYFIDMTMNVFGMSESSSRLFITIAGYLDLLICIGIWIPVIRKPILYYAVFWGLITALARIIGNFNPDIWVYSLNSWWFQTVFRIVHGIGPFIMLIILNSISREEKETKKIQQKFNL